MLVERAGAIHTTGVDRGPGGGGGGGMYTPTFWCGGWPVQIHPPLFEDKITEHLTFIVKKLTLFNCKTSKNSKARSLARTQMYSEARSLRFCQYSDNIICVQKGVE